MKRILFFATIFASILFSSCKKEPVVLTPQDYLIGKWKVTKFIFHGTNAVKETATNKVAFELEFKASGDVTFTSTNTDKTVTPNKDYVNITNNMYSWGLGDSLTLTATNATESVSVTGPAEVTATKFVFTATSGNTNEFLESLEAEKL